MCRQLRDKSVTNFDAARILKETNYHHCSSIHCSYYSCFQAIKFILLSIFGIDEHAFEAKRFADLSGKQGLHLLYINDLYTKLNSEKFTEDAKNFRSKILALRTLRVQADYGQIRMESIHSAEAFTLATDIKRILQNIYRYETA